MNLGTVLVWIQIGEEMVKVAQGSLETVRAALAAKGIEADNAQLDRIAAGYDERIARAQAAAQRPTSPDPAPGT